MEKVKAFVLLSRPHFLLGPFLFFALGATTSADLDLGNYLWAQLMVTSAQITAHYVNEYADVAADALVANRTPFSGGSGVLAGGALEPRVALWAGIASSVIALATAAIVATFSPAAAALGVASLAISWAYSIPPMRLLDTGWGELATTIVVVGFVPMIGATATGGSLTTFLLWSIALLIPLHVAMLLAFEIPDAETDAAAGKTVLAVRLGEVDTRRLLATLYGIAYVVGLGLVASTVAPSGIAIAHAAAAPFVAIALWATRSDRFVWLTTSAVGALAVAAAALLLAAPNAPGS